MKFSQFIIIAVFAVMMTGCKSDRQQKTKFEPSFESLEKSNPAPEWFKDAKFGIYFHWGVYSVPAYANEWYPRTMYIKGSAENIHHENIYGRIEDWPYNNFITGAKDKQGNFVQFSPALKSQGGHFDPDEWAQLFADAGAKFAGPVAEHHDGFSMWASRVNPWNAAETGPRMDLVRLLTDAIRKKNMKIILSMHHAYNITGFYDAVPPLQDLKLQKLYGQQGKEQNEAFWLAKHKEIIDYYKPDIIWQDFNLHKISEPVLLQFLAYYYNSASEWNKEVVATYKDGLNTKCAVLDYERGGPSGIIDEYWLTDDAISSSSWSYTTGIGYYSIKQILHGFIDRVSKNGNLLLNISPMADGTIPQEQKDILLSMGTWLNKYGEAIYATRAWEKFGEGPTRMGGAHGVMGAPVEGTARDIRYTRSKDAKSLYAILMGWEKDQKQILLTTLSSDRTDLKNLKTVELINGEAGKYLPLTYEQNKEGLVIHLPDRAFDELAYVIRLRFEDQIPSPDPYADLNVKTHYYLVPGNNPGNLMLGENMLLSEGRRDPSNQWKLEKSGKGVYIFRNRKDNTRVLTSVVDSGKPFPKTDVFSDADNQYWKIEQTGSGMYQISSRQNSRLLLSLISPVAKGSKAILSLSEPGNSGWNLIEVCETKQASFKSNFIPGIIEAEDFDKGCQETGFFDTDELNEGGAYRQYEPVDIEKCANGGFNVGWTKKGEWLAYTVTVGKSATYNAAIHIATNQENVSIHIESDGSDVSGNIPVPNTTGYQSWKVINYPVKLTSGKHVLKIVMDTGGLNLDKMVFQIKK